MGQEPKTSELKKQAAETKQSVKQQEAQVTHPAPGSGSKPTVWTKEQQNEYAKSQQRLDDLNKKLEKRPTTQFNRSADRSRDDRGR